MTLLVCDTAWGRERGSATVSLLGIAISSVLVVGVAMGLAGLVQKRIALQSAADLAALAAATELHYRPVNDPCNPASEIAQRNDADLAKCEPYGQSVQVKVRGQYASWTVEAIARAGPAGHE